jgi:hypothetical protein
MWATMSAPLLISADVGQASEHLLETWGNEEVIAVSQSFRGTAGKCVGGHVDYSRRTTI